MKKIILVTLFLLTSNYLFAQDNLKFYVEKALANNLQLNAERKILSSKQSKNISRSEFLPSITLSGDQSSTSSKNRRDHNGNILADANSILKVKKS